MAAPKPTSKVLNPSGHVPMKAQMAHASVPHGHFQEGSAADKMGDKRRALPEGTVREEAYDMKAKH